MERLTPIPISWTARWDSFRRVALPILAFTAVLGATVWNWQHLAAGDIAALAEAPQSLVSAPQNAVLERLLVQPYEFVKAGQPLAVLVPFDPRSALDVWQAELALGRLQAEPSVAEGNAMNFERFRAELLRQRTEIEVARVNLLRSEREVARYTPLYDEKLLSEDVFELSRSTRDALRAEVESKEGVVELMQERLEALEGLGVPESSPRAARDQTLARIEQLRSAALTNLAPVTLFAPREGMVQGIFRQGGENVVLGEPLFTLSPLRSDRIVGYLRQPYPLTLQPGLAVQIITRESPRRIIASEISQVGARVEIITNSLAFVRPNALVDSGLPFVVRLPADVDLRPGEIVDLRVLDATSAASVSPSQPPDLANSNRPLVSP